MNCIRRRIGRNFASRIAAMSTLSIRIAPLVGSTSRATQRATVDLPEPDSPTMPSVSPRRIVSETSLTALTIRAFGWNSERLP